MRMLGGVVRSLHSNSNCTRTTSHKHTSAKGVLEDVSLREATSGERATDEARKTDPG